MASKLGDDGESSISQTGHRRQTGKALARNHNTGEVCRLQCRPCAVLLSLAALAIARDSIRPAVVYGRTIDVN